MRRRTRTSHTNIHVEVPANVNESAESLQSTPELLPKDSMKYVTDALKRQETPLLKIEYMASLVFQTLDSQG